MTAARYPEPTMVLVADLEGTLTAGETWKGVARWLEELGRGTAYRRFFVSHLPGALMAKAGLIDKRAYQDRWMADLARLLAGLSESQLAEMGEWVTEHTLWPARHDTVLTELLQAFSRGARVILASATYQPVLEAFARRLGEGVVALGTPLETVQGRATGRLGGPVNAGSAKAGRVRVYLGGSSPDRAYGDSWPDRYLLELSAEPVAVRPDRRLMALARERGWRRLV